MIVLSFEAEMAMLVFVRLWPIVTEEIWPRWDESVRCGVYVAASVEVANERRDGNDQTWIWASAAPDRMCIWSGEIAREVMGSRWEAGVVTRRPVESYFSVSASLFGDLFCFENDPRALWGVKRTSHTMSLPPSVPITKHPVPSS